MVVLHLLWKGGLPVPVQIGGELSVGIGSARLSLPSPWAPEGQVFYSFCSESLPRLCYEKLPRDFS